MFHITQPLGIWSIMATFSGDVQYSQVMGQLPTPAITRWYPWFIGWSERPHWAMNSPPRVARSATGFVQRPHVSAVAWAVRSGLDDMWGTVGAPLWHWCGRLVPLFVGSTGEKKTST